MYSSKFVAASLVLAFLAPLSVHSQQAPSLEQSVIRVQELLRLEESQLEQKARDKAIKADILSSPVAVDGLSKPVDVAPVWSVVSMYGAGSKLYVDLKRDGVEFTRVGPGETVGQCRLSTINPQDACVGLEPVSRKVKKGQCPTTLCWTGDEMAQKLNPPQVLPSPGAGELKTVPPPLPPLAAPIQASSGAGGVTSPRPAEKQP